MMRQKLAEAKPDVRITIGNDHLHQFFMDNMPPFMIGKMDTYDGHFMTRSTVWPADPQIARRPGSIRSHSLECLG